ncbi:MAG: hypothetical protein ACXAEN_19615 [Candidatus Thorarchaeota archaeon]
MYMFLLIIPQSAFVYFMVRRYENRTTTKNTLAVGLIGLLPLFVFGVLNALPRLWSPGYPYGFDLIPFPVIVVIGYFFLKIFPPIEKPLDWLDE